VDLYRILSFSLWGILKDAWGSGKSCMDSEGLSRGGNGRCVGAELRTRESINIISGLVVLRAESSRGPLWEARGW